AFRRSLASAGAAGRLEGGRETWWDEGQFRDLGARRPEVGEIAILRREQGFANELRFRYDVLFTRGPGERRPAETDKRLWTGWHAAARPDVPPPDRATADDLAYVIHTSGSTGVPKGIGVQHRPVVHLLDGVNGRFRIGPG